MLQGIPSIMVSRFAVDADAQAFIDAAGITNPTQQYAINTVVVAAKLNGWWTLCNAIYPMVGGTQTTCKYNLKDPRDLDAAFRLNFQGGWTYSATGVLPNGTTGYANTFLVPSSVLTIYDTHISYYSRTNSDGLYGDIAVSNGPSQQMVLYVRYSNLLITDAYDTTSNGRLSVSNTDSSGLALSSRVSTTDFSAYRNGVLLGTLSVNSGLLPTTNSLYICATNTSGVPIQFSNRECAFATIGAGISSTIAALMYTDIQNFQTTLGRQV